MKAGIASTITAVILMLFFSSSTMAQRFYNLTADEVKIDSVLPTVSYVMPLIGNQQDSVYTAEVKYAEYIDMTPADIEAYNKLSDREMPTQPIVNQAIITTNKKQSIMFSLSPFVCRDGKCQILVSYMLDIKASPATKAKNASRSAADRYADHSILASGHWAKIRVGESGFYQLTESVIRKAGFRDINKVKIYGYGGYLVPEILNDNYLRQNDDLKEVPSAIISGRRIFYGKGSVTWNSSTTDARTRNPYSDYGYYFITENDNEPLLVSQDELLKANYPCPNDYHTLHEVDNYAWFEGGRNLVEGTMITESKTYKLDAPSSDATGSITVSLSSGNETAFNIYVNDKNVGSAKITMASYDKAEFITRTYNVPNLQASNDIKIEVTSGGPARLDYISLRTATPKPATDLTSTSLPAAEYVYNITNQDHHADKAVDLTIIIPTSQVLLEQAERLKALHEQKDGMTVRIVPADEMYNEFSSGTPDVSAYRRYMKMMYDRATTESEQPKYLLLFGDCVWDNRLLTTECRTLNPDNLLLCHESENSYSTVFCYVSDDFIGILDDNEALTSGGEFLGTPDIGVGRLPVLTESMAKGVVDKIIAYVNNENVGSWQNTVMFMGDDGNNNLHMNDVNIVADDIAKIYPGYHVRKVMWDAYKRTDSSTGSRFPDVEDAIMQQQQAGALIMDYAGHGSANSISHEHVLGLPDFVAFNNSNLPLWITASCDIGPFDGTESTIGETVVTNPNGGGIAFFGTTRTVYANYNKHINDEFMKAVLGSTNGKHNTIGDANRIAKCKVVEKKLDKTVNKVQYSLLGDPALRIHVPKATCVVDSINGIKIGPDNIPTIAANSKVRVSGHIEMNGSIMTDLEGLITILVRDSKEKQVCMNNAHEADTLFTFYDRTKNLFHGTDNVKNGKYSITFTVPRDINYSNANGLITLFAHNADGSITAHGESDQFLIGGSEEMANDLIGPSIYCYLNSPSFVNGGDVNDTPYFVAEIKDKDGINASGVGIGHDLQLVIDNQVGMTYNLNENFQFDFGTYTSGSTYFSIPTLAEGPHTLRFRAWDILNNPSTTTLSFNVVSAQKPTIADVNVTKNPAKTSTTFIATHDRPGSVVNMKVEIFDMSGRLLHTMSKSSTANSVTSTITWDLTTRNGSRLQTGVYLYRVSVGSNESAITSKAKKLIIINN